MRAKKKCKKWPPSYFFGLFKAEYCILKELLDANLPAVNHIIGGRRIPPLSSPILVSCKFFADRLERNLYEMNIDITDARFGDLSSAYIEAATSLQATILNGHSYTELYNNDNDEVLFSSTTLPSIDLMSRDSPHLGKTIYTQTKEEAYSELERRGYNFNQSYQLFNTVDVTTRGRRARIPFTTCPFTKIELLLQLYLLDRPQPSPREQFLPLSIGRINLTKSNAEGDDTELELCYDHFMDELYCSGVLIKKIRCKNVRNISSDLTFDGIKIVHHQNPSEKAGLIIFFADGLFGPTVNGLFSLVLYAGKKIVGEISSQIKAQNNSTRGDWQHVILPDRPTKEKLFSLLKKISINGKPLLVVSKNLPGEDFVLFKNRIERKIKAPIRWLFILDNDAPTFSVDNGFYKKQLEKGLPVNILKGGIWNSIIEQPLQINKNIASDIASKLVTDLFKFEYFGYSQENDCLVDFTGRDANSEVMGIYSVNDRQVFLSWPKPSSWTAQEAVTVPIAYALAYFCLGGSSQVKPYETVLVTDGLSVLGQAAITVALQLAKQVYATVASDDDSVLLKSLFPQIKERHIFNHTDINVSYQLRLLAEELPEVVYSTFDGPHFFELYKSMAPFSRIYHHGMGPVNKNSNIGMFRFNFQMSLCVTGVDSLSNSSGTVKKVLHDNISEGIRTGVVRPPTVSFVDKEKKFKTETTHIVQRYDLWKPKFCINSKSTYLIVGSGSNSDVVILDWLVGQGARNIVFHRPNNNNNAQLLNKYNAKSLRLRIFEEQHLDVLVKEVKSEKICFNGIFVISLTNSCNQAILDNFQDIMSGSGHLVIISSSTNTSFLQVPSSRVVTNIVWPAGQPLNGANLDQAFKFVGEQDVITVATSMPTPGNSVRQETVLSKILPTSAEAWVQLEADADLPRFKKLPYGCTSSDGLSPTFIFPGFEEDQQLYTQVLAANSMVPLYLAQYSGDKTQPLTYEAETFACAIKAIHRKTTMNIVGFKTDCAVAIAVAHVLEEQGHDVALLLVDNPILALQQRFTKEDKLEKLLQHRLSDLFANQLISLSTSKEMNRTVSSNMAQRRIYEGVLNAFNYNMSDIKLRGPVNVLRSTDVQDDFNYYELCTTSKVFDIALDYKSLQRSKELINVMNQFVINDNFARHLVHENLWEKFERLVRPHCNRIYRI